MNSNIIIQKVTQKDADFEAAIDLFSLAFQTEAFTKYQFKLTQPRAMNKLKDGISLIADNFISAGYDLYIAKRAEEVVGIAVLQRPEDNVFKWANTKRIIKNVHKLLPILTIINYRNLFRLSRAETPQKKLRDDHITLVVIGVNPAYQGQGIGKQILEFITHAYQSKYHGIYLYTGDESNYHLYQKKGYQLIDQVVLEDLTIYHMYQLLKD